MTSDDSGGPTLQQTLGQLVRPVFAAAFTGVADPPPKHQDWPRRLRWTRRIGIGRLPFEQVVVLLDVIIALIIIVGTFNELLHQVHQRDPGYSGGTLLLAATLLAVPVVLRNRHPVAAWRLLIVMMLILESQHWVDTPYIVGGVFSGLLCLYSVAVRSSREVTFGVGGLSTAGVFVLNVQTAAVATMLILVPLLVGYSVRERRANRRVLAEQERRHQDAEAVLTERQRIARELHDVVAHHMSMIAIQAEASPYTVPDMHDKTRADLAEIRSTALAALNETRRILGVLRSAEGIQTAPQPSLERIEDLVANARSAGLTVDLEMSGRPEELPPGVGLTAYRILQEALSNAMQHAPGSKVCIEVSHRPKVLRLGVVNGPPARAETGSRPGGGHGLIGMRERAGMLGGELIAAPTPEGGFGVSAILPLEGAA